MSGHTSVPRRPSNSGIELSLIFVSLLLGGLAVWLTTWDPLWDAIGVTDTELRASLGPALSIVLLLAGFLPAVYLQIGRLEKHTTAETDRLIERLIALVPQLPALEVVTSSAAYDYLARNLTSAEHVYNTRLAGRGVFPTYNSPSGQMYRKSLEKLIAGGLQFCEVVSPAWAQDAENLEQAVGRRKAKHYYSYLVLDSDIPPILNFAIIKYEDGRREVVCGWVNSKTRGYEQPSLIFRDLRVVDYFQTWYDELEREAERK